MDSLPLYIIILITGFIVGIINTIAGGGSLLTLPILIFCGLPPNVANGTNRIGIVFQTAFASAGFKSKGVSTFPFNVYLGISAVFGALIGAHIAVDVKGETFTKMLSVVLIVAGLLIIFKPKIKAEQLEERLTGKHLWIGIISFFFFGIYGGFLNAGIGFIMILFLHFVHRMNLVRVNATKVVVVFIYTISALIVFIVNDKVNWKIGLILAAGNAIGAWFGSRFAVMKGDRFIKPFLLVILILMAVKLWFF
ncbi:sulfite exporter TauE/SafE family protein [Aestuariibaculum sediminum]|uniref:Probable membrane transporter protein n=1 Tax=Aestuariibaculum sediminum TaxID=2770637 RepID=A0A8J6PYL8_9FLAO|nr:sulfite exporter TauE/SafE family protein [Aestuariibaculum sediminum]MBD0831157.1 sulfite exporter TauE/SafE family protein [Aestuariibaculum sediminum]